MHSVFITHKTGSNEEITFEDFYQVIAKYHDRQKEDKMLRNGWVSVKNDLIAFMHKYTDFNWPIVIKNE